MNKFEMPEIELLMFDEEEIVLDASSERIGFTKGNEYNENALVIPFKQEMVNVSG